MHRLILSNLSTFLYAYQTLFYSDNPIKSFLVVHKTNIDLPSVFYLGFRRTILAMLLFRLEDFHLF